MKRTLQRLRQDLGGDGPNPAALRPRVRGRVLRVKHGYNPNSSSVGSAIPAFLVAGLSVGAAAVLIAHLLSEIADRLRIRRRADRPGDEDADSS